ncbi:allantoate amidohydrolase [Gluconacetobacter sp. 1b LMG 1731]|uniref:Allantoate amidohydrolase n=1 Tax=Gluconacetobacter dulcium TaxID=2729096 RepID=A0A7W4IMW2_9PROT|nr:allantoate amidohydrolase [Gluconacetobacter dulcium]MBB2165679.1 allantoate amidohydrolase [Gluconacetobacter dulcium]MBB2194896.1 allantoate amidohydrolase [Gluconacetobacter dulcium]
MVKMPARETASGLRAVARCDDLGVAPYSDSDDHLFRPYLGAGHAATLDRIAAWMTEAGMTARVDAAGNIVGRYEGRHPDAPALVIGSHVDSVRDGGRYDGMLGVMLGIETVAWFAERGRRFAFAIEVIGFGDEEGSRFPVSMLTTRAVAGVLGDQDLALVDAAGVGLAEALDGFGLDVTRFVDAAREREDVLAYVEAHIEQGPVLEAEGHALGVVSAIAAQYRFRAVVTGVAGHAGTMAMRLRHDALAAAAEMVLAVERIGGAGPEDLVATVGRMEVGPGVPNVVPGAVTFSIDIRAGVDGVRDRAAEAIQAVLPEIAARRGVGLELTLQQDLPATPCDSGLSALMADAVSAVTGAAPRVLVSGAGHDAMVMARLAPVSMVFLRCRGGISHNPAEAVEVEDVQVALEAMTAFVSRFEQTGAGAGAALTQEER